MMIDPRIARQIQEAMFVKQKFLAPVLLPLGLAACGSVTETREPADMVGPSATSPAALVAPSPVACDNASLTAHASLLILAPHPDDEVLGFAGLADAYRRQGKPVRTLVVTDGDAYCEACALWSGGDLFGPTCDARDLSNFETPAVDSFAEVRRLESTAAASILGLPEPAFLGYPDTGIAAAWYNRGEGRPGAALHRSDFSACSRCGDCEGDPSFGYGSGPATELSAETLVETLRDLMAASDENALVATTHWLDGHGDHAGLGEFVRQVNAELDVPRTLAFAVIHAHTPRDHAFPDCWYPGPAATECPCFDAEAGELAMLRAHRERPDWPQELPDDADYGDPAQLCLAPELVGNGALKPRAIEAFESQTGTKGRVPGLPPPERSGVMDCNGYLLSFGRRSEVFVVQSPQPEEQAVD